jgi:Putative porin
VSIQHIKKRYDVSTAAEPATAAKRYGTMGSAAMLLLFFFGCAAPGPVTIQHEGTPSLSEVTQPKDEASEERAAQIAPIFRKERSGAADAERRKEPADQKTEALLELLKSKKLISDEEAALITGQTTTRTAGEQAPLVTGQTMTGNAGEQGTVSGPQQSTEELKEEIRRDVTNELLRQVWSINQAMKEKDTRLRFGGDIRLRYEKDFFDKNNFVGSQVSQGAFTNTFDNTVADQQFFKFRVRFGADAQVNNQVEAVLRLSTGNTTNPVSTNATMGDYMNKDNVVFDLAYLKWHPGKVLALYGGRMPNPFFSSDLVWAKDLNFEGFALNVRQPASEAWTPFLTVGAFPLQQSGPTNIDDFSQHYKWLYAGQVGLERKKQQGVSAKIGGAYYAFHNITGVPNNDPGHPGATDWSAPFFTQGGNTYFQLDPANNGAKIGLVSEFKELNVTGTLDVGFWDPVHVLFLGDYVRNFGFNQDDVNALRGQTTPKEVMGYQLGMAVGYPTVQESGQWKVYFYKKYLEADAVVDAFTDPDFHLGGTNAKGWILGTDIGLAKNYWMTIRWLAADEISGPPLAIDVLQVDINAKF